MCFSLEAVKELAIWIVVVCAVVMLVRLLLSQLAPQLPLMGVVVQALWIVAWAVAAVAVVVLVFDLLSCLLPLPRLR